DWLRGTGSRARLEEMDNPGPTPGRRGVPAWRSIAGLAEGDRLVVFPGRADWENGAVTFIDAVRLLRLAGQPAVPAIVNPGPIDDWLRRLWQASRVPIVGIVVADAAERASLLAAADLIVLPADSCAEAAPAETPVLAPEGQNSPVREAPLRLLPAGEPREPAKERRLQHAVTQAEGGRAAQDRELGKRPLPLVAQAVAVGALLLAEGLQLGALDLEPVALAQPLVSLRAQPLTLDAKLLALDEEVVGRPLGLGDLLLQERPEPLQVDGGGTRVLRILGAARMLRQDLAVDADDLVDRRLPPRLGADASRHAGGVGGV